MMNLHLPNHIKDTVVDYGPSHAFWCFPFERYNGVLGSFYQHEGNSSASPYLMNQTLTPSLSSLELLPKKSTGIGLPVSLK